MPKISAGHRDMQWHFIGRIQSNKTREIAANFAWAQTVTSARTAERLSSQRPHYGSELQVCIQIQPAAGAGNGPGARGLAARGPDVAALAALIATLPRLRLRGLMLIPHPDLSASGTAQRSSGRHASCLTNCAPADTRSIPCRWACRMTSSWQSRKAVRWCVSAQPCLGHGRSQWIIQPASRHEPSRPHVSE